MRVTEIRVNQIRVNQGLGVYNFCLHFERQDGQDGKNRKENHATKVTKIPNTKRQKYGMNKTKVLRKKF